MSKRTEKTIDNFRAQGGEPKEELMTLRFSLFKVLPHNRGPPLTVLLQTDMERWLLPCVLGQLAFVLF